VAVAAVTFLVVVLLAQAAQVLSLSNGRKPLKHAQHLHLLVTG
jgi:hypothetical protein